MFFSFSGSVSQIFGPKCEILSVPWYTILNITLETQKHVLSCKNFH